MATLRTISVRLKSVKSIQKITKSMKMVKGLKGEGSISPKGEYGVLRFKNISFENDLKAEVSAAKYARAERELKAARPLGQGAEQFFEKAELSKQLEKEKDADKKRNLLYVAVTSDRGLCGAVHSSVARLVRNSVTGSKDEVRIVCVGDKSKGILHYKLGQHFLFVCNEVGRLPPTFLDACKIVNEILKSDYEFDLGKIVFNKFRSVVSYATSEIPLYHLRTMMASEKVQNYEEADEETMASFVEFSMAGLVFYALKEGACSEQSARMTAMDNASKNAGEMIQALTLAFNRTRQAVITRELIEIISGASAL